MDAPQTAFDPPPLHSWATQQPHIAAEFPEIGFSVLSKEPPMAPLPDLPPPRVLL